MKNTRRALLYSGPSDHHLSAVIDRWARERGLIPESYQDPAEVATMVMRGRGSLIVLDGGDATERHLALVRQLKDDSFSAIVPVAVYARDTPLAQVLEWYQAGADEVITGQFADTEQVARLGALLARTERDVAVHPSTRLPGTTEIDREIRRRLVSETTFAVCYADLDHFKEYNDRYSYYDGDRVIHLLSRILHDVVRGLLGTEGFVGHIGGDDFIFVVPYDAHATTCRDVLAVFDELIPLQYNEQDRRAGYFFGKDRRGQLHRVPLMTLSIGVVTNHNRTFTHPAQVSELATEMKSYSKTLPGSVFVVDRRRGDHEIRSGPGGKDARNP